MKSVDEKKRASREDAIEMIVEYLPKIVVAVFTGYFTWHAAWYLTQSRDMSLMMVLLAEGFWLLWQYMIDENAENESQTKNARFSWKMSIAFVAITDLSSGVFMAHDAGFSAFATIPEWAQVAPAVLIPLMAIAQGVALAVYTGNSDSRVEFMAVRKEKRQARNAERLAQAQAEKAVAISNAERTAELAKQNAPLIGSRQAEDNFVARYGNAMALDVEDATTANPTPPKRR